MKPCSISYGTSDLFSIPLVAKELLTFGTDDGIAWFYSDNNLTIEFFLNGRADFKKRTVIGSCSIPYQVDTIESGKILQRNNIVFNRDAPVKPIDSRVNYLEQLFPEFIDKATRKHPEKSVEIRDIISTFCDFMYRFHKAPTVLWMPKDVKHCILEDLIIKPYISQWEKENSIPVLCQFFAYLKSKGVLPRADAIILAANGIRDQFLRMCQTPVQVHTNISPSLTRPGTVSQMPDPTRPTSALKKPTKPVATPVQRASTVPHGTSALPFGALLYNPHDMMPGVDNPRRFPELDAGIPVEVISIYKPLHTLCNKFCDLHPDVPIREGCLQLLKAYAEKKAHPLPLLSGQRDVWGAGIVYATCQAAGLSRRKNRRGIGADEVAAFFNVVQTAPSGKAWFIKSDIRLFKHRLWDRTTKIDLTDVFDPVWAERFREWARYNV